MRRAKTLSMKPIYRLPTALLLVVCVLSACGLSDKTGRFLDGTEPDEAVPTVPRPPSDGPTRGPGVVLLALPGFSATLAERGMRDGWLPVLRRLRIDATWSRLAASPEVASGALRAGSTILLGADRDPGAAYFVSDASATSLFADARVPPGYSALLPRVGFPLGGTLFDQASRSGKDAFVLRWPVGLADGGEKARDLRGGAFPGASFGNGGYTLVRETLGEPTQRSLTHGTVLEVSRSTGGSEFDVFRFDVEGLPDGPVGAPLLTTMVEAFAAPDRSSVRVMSSSGEVEVLAGRWSKPLPLRFLSTAGKALFARARMYLRPTGLPKMELLIEEPQFDPLRPPAWQSLSSPEELAGEMDTDFRRLPSASSVSAALAILDGVIDARDAAATLETDHHKRRQVFEDVLSLGDTDLLIQWMPLMEDATKLVQATPNLEREVEMFGRRIPWSAGDEASASALDEVIGAVLTAASENTIAEEITLVVVSPYGITSGRPDPSEGWWAVTRLTASSARSTRLVDIAPTVSNLLGISPPPGAQGVAWSYGPPMERLVEVELSHERFVEPAEEGSPAEE